jgi:hypothetical protein
MLGSRATTLNDRIWVFLSSSGSRVMRFFERKLAFSALRATGG